MENAQREGLEIEHQSNVSNKGFVTTVVNSENNKKEVAPSTPTVIYGGCDNVQKNRFHGDLGCDSDSRKRKFKYASPLHSNSMEVENCAGTKGVEKEDVYKKEQDNTLSDETTKHSRSSFHSTHRDSNRKESKDTSSSNNSCTDDTDVEWDSDSNPWLGCVCGETHEKPVPVFWVQCDSCDAWYNCSSSCVGFTEDEAKKINDWMCPDCLLTEKGMISNYDLSKDNKPLKSPFGNNKNSKSAIQIGSIVDVQDRTWIGSNKPGGVAKVIDVHIDSDDCITYDVKYVLENRTEKNIESEYIFLNCSMMDDLASPCRKTRISGSARSSAQKSID